MNLQDTQGLRVKINFCVRSQNENQLLLRVLEWKLTSGQGIIKINFCVDPTQKLIFIPRPYVYPKNNCSLSTSETMLLQAYRWNVSASMTTGRVDVPFVASVPVVATSLIFQQFSKNKQSIDTPGVESRLICFESAKKKKLFNSRWLVGTHFLQKLLTSRAK